MSKKDFLFSDLAKKFPPEVQKIFAIFGGDIRLVGGCVRDLILAKNLADFDFATKFLPQEVMKILEENKIKSVPTGVKFGTVTAVVNGKNFEITTLRKDLDHDGRHCDVEFVDDYFFDAARRDFTINALYLDSSGLVTDYFDGISDLKNGVVKFIGDPAQRIEEDFLRILRFFRFSCQYAQKLDLEGLRACAAQKKNLAKLSRERIRQEFLKMLASANKEKLSEILQAMIDEKISDEIFSFGLDVPSFSRLGDESLELKIATVLVQKNCDLKILAQEICATNAEKKLWQFCLDNFLELDLSAAKELLAFHKKEIVVDLCKFLWAKNLLKNLEILAFVENFSVPNFPLNGEEVMLLGLRNEKVGEALNEAKIFWVKSDFTAQKTDLLNYLKKKFRLN